MGKVRATLADKTLEELENDYWDEPTFRSSLVLKCHRIRKVPLRDLADEDLRLMIGQKFSLRYLLPLALGRLKANPPASGHLYQGDLLSNILSLPQSVWDERPDLHAEARGIADRFLDRSKDLGESLHDIIEPDFKATYERFVSQTRQ